MPAAKCRDHTSRQIQSERNQQRSQLTIFFVKNNRSNQTDLQPTRQQVKRRSNGGDIGKKIQRDRANHPQPKAKENEPRCDPRKKLQLTVVSALGRFPGQPRGRDHCNTCPPRINEYSFLFGCNPVFPQSEETPKKESRETRA